MYDRAAAVYIMNGMQSSRGAETCRIMSAASSPHGSSASSLAAAAELHARASRVYSIDQILGHAGRPCTSPSGGIRADGKSKIIFFNYRVYEFYLNSEGHSHFFFYLFNIKLILAKSKYNNIIYIHKGVNEIHNAWMTLNSPDTPLYRDYTDYIIILR
jgi:hypothetical protein